MSKDLRVHIIYWAMKSLFTNHFTTNFLLSGTFIHLKYGQSFTSAHCKYNLKASSGDGTYERDSIVCNGTEIVITLSE